MSGDIKDRRGSQELEETDQSQIPQQQRPELHRTSSGFSEPIPDGSATASSSILPDDCAVHESLQQLTVPPATEARRVSDDRDSGLDSPVTPFPGSGPYRYPTPSKGGAAVTVTPVQLIGRGPGTKTNPTTEHAEKHKLVLDELQSKIGHRPRPRSYSQSDLAVKFLYGDAGEREIGNYVKREKPIGRKWKSTKEKAPLSDEGDVSDVGVKKEPNLARSSTLPSNVSKRYPETDSYYSNVVNADGGNQRKKQLDIKNKSFSFKNKLSKLTRTISTRTKPKQNKRKNKRSSFSDTLSDSDERYDNIISPPLGRPLKSTHRLSRSMDTLFDHGYDVVEPTYFDDTNAQSNEDTYDEDPYEPINFENQTSSELHRTPLIIPGKQKYKPEQLHQLPTQKGKIALKPPDVSVLRRRIPTKRPLKPPDANVNLQMVKQVIEDIMRHDPEAIKTEIVVQTHNFVAKFCDENGGFLEVGNKIASLMVPPYAIDEDSSGEYPTLIYIHIEESFNFTEGKEGHPIAPVVRCGKPGTKFKSPVILTFQTSVQNAKKINVTGLRQQDNDSDWHETTKDEGKLVSLEKGLCTMMLNHFTGVNALGQPKDEERAPNAENQSRAEGNTQNAAAGQPRGGEENAHFGVIKFSAFTSPVLREKDHVFDIRVLLSSNDEKLKQEEDREVEESHAKRLGHFRPTLNLFDGGGDLNIAIVNLNNQWCPAGSALEETLKFAKLKYDYDHGGINESRVFHIKPTRTSGAQHQDVNFDQAVNFDIALYQIKKADFGEKLRVNVLPELAQKQHVPGQQQSFHVVRQRAGWKPSKRSLQMLERSLSVDGRWKQLAAWFHLDSNVLESLSSPVSGMLSMLCNKHAGNDCMKIVIHELKEPLDKAGNECREAKEIVADMLRESPSLGVDGAVVVRKATQDTWPRESWDATQFTCQVNDYRFFGTPRAYGTLRSDDTPRLATTVHPPVYSETSYYGRSLATGAAGGNLSEGAAGPHTLSSMRGGVCHNETRSAPVPVQGNWPPGEADEDPSLVPKGPYRRKSSGYETIPIDIDPSRPPAQLPEIQEGPYDLPVNLPEVPEGFHVMANHVENNIENNNVEINEAGLQEHYVANLELEQGPDYVNLPHGSKLKSPKNKGYVGGIKNSRKQHPTDDQDPTN